MDAVTELKLKLGKLKFEVEKFLVMDDVEECRKSGNKIKELATDIVNLKKELKGEKELKKEYKKRRR